MKKIFTLFSMLGISSVAYNQCQTSSFFGLESSYSCPDPSELSGTPFEGIFQGPGIIGNLFSPLLAGVGTHVITYSTPPSSPVAGYIATAGLPNAPVTEPLTPVTLMDDELSTALPIGFDFNFFGVTYNEFAISSNGYITFDVGSLTNGCCSGQFIPDNWEANNLIALAWNDLNPSSGGSIGYTTIGDAPNRILIVEFNDVPHYGGLTNNIFVQAKLFESNGNIEIHCTQNISDGSPHTIGVENATGTCGITATGMNANDSLSVVNEMILFTQDPGSYYLHQTGLPTNLYTGTMTGITLGNDELSPAIPLGFSFDFYGTNYTEAYISSNGFLTFDNSSNSGCCEGALIPGASEPNNLIAFAWNELNPTLGGSIGYTTIGNAPDRVFILDYDGIQHVGGGDPIKLQVKLFETSNLIEIHSTVNVSNGVAMTMGLENQTGTEAISPANRNANPAFSVIDERTIFYPYYTAVQITEVISVDDVEAPVPFDSFLEPIFAQCEVPFLNEPFADDNCSGFVVGTTNVAFPITESTTVVWTFMDAAGNTSTLEQEVVIADTQAPIASGFIITITCEQFLADEVVWTFTDGTGSVVASGGPYMGGGPGEVLEVANVNGTNGPYTFMGTTQGNFNDNVFSFTIQCQGAVVAQGLVDAGQTVNVNNIASCNSFTDIVSYCEITSLESVSATDNCAGTVVGTNDAVFPITENTTITWFFDDGNGNVTIESQNIVIQSMNTEVNTIGSSLVAAEITPGVTYSWVDCNNNMLPLGVTNQAFIPTSNGSYAVILQIGECTVTSACIEVTDLSLQQLTGDLFVIYPNPANETVYIESTQSGSVDILDISGKIVKSLLVENGVNKIDVGGFADGAYTIRMISTQNVQTRRLVINN